MVDKIITEAATGRSTERELRIEIRQDEHFEFEGTAAQLTAEGLIPKDFEWPRAAADESWEANGFKYWLRRSRPEGHKGPMRSWLELDNWFVRVEVAGHDNQWRIRRHLERKTEELKAEYYWHSAAGQRERNANWKRYVAARDDRAFQAFKDKFMPERKKPGRRVKSA